MSSLPYGYFLFVSFDPFLPPLGVPALRSLGACDPCHVLGEVRGGRESMAEVKREPAFILKSWGHLYVENFIYVG